MNKSTRLLSKLKSAMDQSWLVSLVTSMLLMMVMTVHIVLFEFSLSFSNSVILVSSVGLTSFFLVRWLVDQFIYNKIKLIYKNINDLKSKEGDLKNVNLRRVHKDVNSWNVKREQEIQKLMVRESYRRQFVGNVAHELKTPIFNIQGYIDTLLDGAIDDKEINRKFLERANKSVGRMIHIVEDLDQITKLEAGTIDIEEEPVDIIEVIQDVVDQLELKAKKRNVNLVVKHQQMGRFLVQVDVEKIKQVLINLIVNAIKYGKEGGEVICRTYSMGEQVLVEVADDGNGIPREHINKIFERFYRVDKSRDRDQGGSGLGLAIVKHIVEAHNQTINIRSTEGEGCTFSFTLKKA
ncbi:MAG: ATP-binding protein [Flavobacteriales bacterium]|jgi:two-component system phosphate regulon sensor histidine kinase PhoR|tara:strand:+ start:1683 stop:2735 length:1053 start_codon:yes stop_codon:yes gene_type:complete